MLKVLVLVEAYPDLKGSAEMAFVHSRCQYYKDAGLDVSVLSFRSKSNYIIDGIQVYTEKSCRRLGLAKSAELVLSHAPNLKNHLRWFFLNPRSFKKLIFFFHGHEVLSKVDYYPEPFDKLKSLSAYRVGEISNKLYDLIKLKILRLFFISPLARSFFYVFVSDWMKDQFLFNLKLHKSAIEGRHQIIPNAINKTFEGNFFQPQFEKKGDFVTLRPFDNPKYCVDLIVKAAEQNPTYTFHIYGRGNYFKYYKKPNNLTVYETNFKQDQIPDLLNQYRGALMPTRLDAQGVMACEIATFGMPLVTSEIPVCKEMLSEFSNVQFLKNKPFEFNADGFLNQLKPTTNTPRTFHAENSIDFEIRIFERLTAIGRDSRPTAYLGSESESKKPSILIIAFTNLARDPRVDRQIEVLKKDFRIIAAGPYPPRHNEVEYIHLPVEPVTIWIKAKGLMLSLFGFSESVYWTLPRHSLALEPLKDVNVDVIIANDLNTLPVVTRIKKGAKVLFDAHEWYPDQHRTTLQHRLIARVNMRLCEKYLKLIDKMTTVSEGLADLYKERFGLDSKLVRNAPVFADLKAKSTQPDKIKMVHHGGASPDRQIHRMIELIDHLDERFTLDLYLVPQDPAYFSILKTEAAKRNNVKLLPPVALRDIPSTLNNYDVGLYLLEPLTVNQQIALPNKFFEYIQGRLAIAAGPGGEMPSLIKKYSLGIALESHDLKAAAKQLLELNAEKIDRYKNASHRVALEWNAEREGETLKKILDGLSH